MIRNGKDSFCLGSTPDTSFTSRLTAETTSGGGTVALGAITTGQLGYDATPGDVQAALVASGLTISDQPQIVVTGSKGKELQLTFAGGSSRRAHGQVTLVANTLAMAAGLSANLDLAGITPLVAGGTTQATLEVEVSSGAIKQTFQKTVNVSDDIIS